METAFDFLKNSSPNENADIREKLQSHQLRGVVENLMENYASYWKTRCELAEKYIDKSPCDPDIYDYQLEAYRKWVEFKTKDQ